MRRTDFIRDVLEQLASLQLAMRDKGYERATVELVMRPTGECAIWLRTNDGEAILQWGRLTNIAIVHGLDFGHASLSAHYLIQQTAPHITESLRPWFEP